MTLIDQTTGVRVLFAGQYWPGANTLYIARAFEDCGAIVRILNETSIYPAEWWSRPGKLIRKALMPLIRREWNSQLLELSEKFKPDLIAKTFFYQILTCLSRDQLELTELKYLQSTA